MKKHIRLVPKEVTAKLKTIEATDIVVACSAKYPSAGIRKGSLRHLEIKLTPKGLIVPGSIVPRATRGRYSDRNVNGQEIVRRDLPMLTKYVSVETPNWGDWYYGSHEVDLPHKYYQRQFIPPQEVEIMMHSPEKSPGLKAYIISFKLNLVLRKGVKGFKKKLFDALNLLQENVGACGIESADVPLEKYAKSLHVSWEILPPGTKSQAIARLFKGRQATMEQKEVAGDRYDFFTALKPRKLVYGSSGFRRYFGALIRDDLVVFENIEYGNAIYIMFRNWPELSKLSRIDLLSGRYGREFVRVAHLKKWKQNVRSIVKHRLRMIDGLGT
jgi:hypothetical protein